MPASDLNLTASITLKPDPKSLTDMRKVIESAFDKLTVGVNPKVAQQARRNINFNPKTGGVSAQFASKDADVLQKIASNADKAVVSMNNFAKGAKGAGEAALTFGERVGFSATRLATYLIPANAIFQVTRAFVEARRAIVDIDRDINRLTQIFEGNASRAGRISEEVLGIATRFGQSGRELLNITTLLAQSGRQFSGTNLTAAVDALAQTKLASTFGEIEDTTRGTIAALNQFNLTGAETVRVLDLANALSKSFAVQSADIFTAVQTGGKAFQIGGGTIEEFSALVASVRQLTGISARTVGTGFNTIFLRLLRPENIKFLDEFTGGKIRDAQGNLKTITEILLATGEAFRGLDKEQKASVAETLFGIRQGKIGIPLLDDISTGRGASVTLSALDKAQRSAGSLASDTNIGLTAIGTSLERIGARFDEVFGELSKDESIRRFFQDVSEAAQRFLDVIDRIGPSIGTLLRVGTLSLIGAGIGSAGSIIKGSSIFAPGSARSAKVRQEKSSGLRDAIRRQVLSLDEQVALRDIEKQKQRQTKIATSISPSIVDANQPQNKRSKLDILQRGRNKLQNSLFAERQIRGGRRLNLISGEVDVNNLRKQQAALDAKIQKSDKLFNNIIKRNALQKAVSIRRTELVADPSQINPTFFKGSQGLPKASRQVIAAQRQAESERRRGVGIFDENSIRFKGLVAKKQLQAARDPSILGQDAERIRALNKVRDNLILTQQKLNQDFINLGLSRQKEKTLIDQSVQKEALLKERIARTEASIADVNKRLAIEKEKSIQKEKNRQARLDQANKIRSRTFSSIFTPAPRFGRPTGGFLNKVGRIATADISGSFGKIGGFLSRVGRFGLNNPIPASLALDSIAQRGFLSKVNPLLAEDGSLRGDFRALGANNRINQRRGGILSGASQGLILGGLSGAGVPGALAGAAIGGLIGSLEDLAGQANETTKAIIQSIANLESLDSREGTRDFDSAINEIRTQAQNNRQLADFANESFFDTLNRNEKNTSFFSRLNPIGQAINGLTLLSDLIEKPDASEVGGTSLADIARNSPQLRAQLDSSLRPLVKNAIEKNPNLVLETTLVDENNQPIFNKDGSLRKVSEVQNELLFKAIIDEEIARRGRILGRDLTQNEADKVRLDFRERIAAAGESRVAGFGLSLNPSEIAAAKETENSIKRLTLELQNFDKQINESINNLNSRILAQQNVRGIIGESRALLNGQRVSPLSESEIASRVDSFRRTIERNDFSSGRSARFELQRNAGGILSGNQLDQLSGIGEANQVIDRVTREIERIQNETKDDGDESARRGVAIRSLINNEISGLSKDNPFVLALGRELRELQRSGEDQLKGLTPEQARSRLERGTEENRRKAVEEFTLRLKEISGNFEVMLDRTQAFNDALVATANLGKFDRSLLVNRLGRESAINEIDPAQRANILSSIANTVPGDLSSSSREVSLLIERIALLRNRQASATGDDFLRITNEIAANNVKLSDAQTRYNIALENSKDKLGLLNQAFGEITQSIQSRLNALQGIGNQSTGEFLRNRRNIDLVSNTGLLSRLTSQRTSDVRGTSELGSEFISRFGLQRSQQIAQSLGGLGLSRESNTLQRALGLSQVSRFGGPNVSKIFDSLAQDIAKQQELDKQIKEEEEKQRKDISNTAANTKRIADILSKLPVNSLASQQNAENPEEVNDVLAGVIESLNSVKDALVKNEETTGTEIKNLIFSMSDLRDSIKEAKINIETDVSGNIVVSGLGTKSVQDRKENIMVFIAMLDTMEKALNGGDPQEEKQKQAIRAAKSQLESLLEKTKE